MVSAALTTYHVYVYTGDKFGAGTDANVYIMLYGETDDTGKMVLKTSKTNRDKFERAKMDEFVIEAVDIGKLRKIKWVESTCSYNFLKSFVVLKM